MYQGGSNSSFAPEDVHRRFMRLNQEIIEWLKGLGEIQLQSLEKILPHNFEQAEKARRDCEQMEFKCMKPLSLFREMNAYKKYVDLKSEVIKLEDVVHPFVQRMHDQRRRITSLYSYFRQLMEVEKQEKNIRTLLSEESSQLSVLTRHQLKRRMQCLHQAMKHLLAAIQRCDMELENQRSLALPQSNTGIASLTRELEQHKNTSTVLTTEVRRQLDTLKRESRFMILQEDTEKAIQELEKYGKQVADAYVMLGVGKTPVEARQYLEEIKKKKEKLMSASQKCLQIIEKYHSLCRTDQRPLIQAKRWESQGKHLSKELFNCVDELIVRLENAFTIYATLDALLNQTEELLMLVLEEQSAKSPRGASRTIHITEQSEHIWSEFLKVEKESLSLLQRLDQPLLTDPIKGINLSMPDVHKIKEATELIIKMKLFTLWVKLQELLRICPGAQSLRERVQRATINLASSSVEEEEILKRNLKSHLNEFYRRMDYYSRKWKNEPALCELSLLEDSLREMKRVQDEIGSMWTSLSRELKAVRDLGIDSLGSQKSLNKLSSKSMTSSSMDLNNEKRSDMATTMHHDAESKYIHFCHTWEDLFDSLQRKCSLLENLAEISNLLHKDELCLELILKEFLEYHRKYDYLSKNLLALESRLAIHEKNLNDFVCHETLNEFADVKGRYQQLKQDFLAYAERLRKFRQILKDMQTMEKLMKEIRDCQEQCQSSDDKSTQTSFLNFDSNLTKRLDSLLNEVKDVDEHRLNESCHQLWGDNSCMGDILSDWRKSVSSLDHLIKTREEVKKMKNDEDKESQILWEEFVPTGSKKPISRIKFADDVACGSSDKTDSHSGHVDIDYTPPPSTSRSNNIHLKHGKTPAVPICRPISAKIESFAIKEGQKLIIPCFLDPNSDSQWVPKKVVWYRNGQRLPVNQSSPWTMSISPERITLMKSRADTRDNGKYKIEIFPSVNDMEPAATAEADIQITRPSTSQPLLKSQLQDLSLKVGDMLHLNCEMNGKEGTHFTVKWDKSGHPISETDTRRQIHTNSAKSSLVIKDVTLQDSGKYSCTVGNSQPFLEEKSSCVVTVQQTPRFVQKFKPQQSLSVGERLNLQCQVESYPACHVNWYHNNTLLRVDESEGSRIMLQRAADCHSLTIKKLIMDDAGTYKCVASNALGKEELVMQLKIDGGDAPQITTSLPSVTEICIGEPLRLTGRFTPYDDNEVNWIYNGTPISGRPGLRVLVFPNHSTLSIDQVRTQDAGIYDLEVRNSRGAGRTQTQVRVKGPETVSETLFQPTDQSDPTTSTLFTSWNVDDFDFVQEEVCPADVNVEAHFTICLDSPEEVTWYVNEHRVDPHEPGAPQPLTLRSQHGHDVFSLIVRRVQREHDGNRYSVVTKKHGLKVLTTFKLNVNHRSGDDAEGEKKVVQFRKGVPPQEHHKQTTASCTNIEKETRQILEDKMKPTDLSASIDVKEEKSSTQEVHHYHHHYYHNPSSNGKIDSSDVVIDDTSSHHLSRTNMILSHTPMKVAPEFSRVFHDAVVNQGETVVLHCQLRGVPKPEVWWSFNGKYVDTKNARISSECVGDEYTLTIDGVAWEDSGRYSFTAENDVGLAGCSAVLFVKDSSKSVNSQQNMDPHCLKTNPNMNSQLVPPFDRNNPNRHSLRSSGRKDHSYSEESQTSHRTLHVHQIPLIPSSSATQKSLFESRIQLETSAGSSVKGSSLSPTSSNPILGGYSTDMSKSSIHLQSQRTHPLYHSLDHHHRIAAPQFHEIPVESEVQIFSLSPTQSGRFRERQKSFNNLAPSVNANPNSMNRTPHK